MIRVLIVDNHAVVRAAIRELLEGTDGIATVGEAVDGREAVDLAMSVRPDVVLMDVAMPTLSGLEATRLLVNQRPDIRVLMFSAEARLKVVRAAREAGAVGFVAKGCRGSDVLRAIRAVGGGRSAWPATT